ncbi:potassium channel subfamily k member 16 [Plakobranchus ocellatus]|uniref:Potassium channel subfamily k member 16 n=1 Tax=Plakobranchus ocellatus TaxID=259542 RepID=A0AAV4AQ14_9GAST|nr:potassium channel subfamily k member 16 [Plakobranchus ocellatus]
MTPSMLIHQGTDSAPDQQHKHHKRDMTSHHSILNPLQDSLNLNLAIAEECGQLPGTVRLEPHITANDDAERDVVHVGACSQYFRTTEQECNHLNDGESHLVTDGAFITVPEMSNSKIEMRRDLNNTGVGSQNTIRKFTRDSQEREVTVQSETCLSNQNDKCQSIDTNSAGSDQQISSKEEAFEKPIYFEGDLRDYANSRGNQDRLGTGNHLKRLSREEQIHQEDQNEYPSALSEALLHPLYSTRSRLKNLAMAVSHSLPSSPRARLPQISPMSRFSQSLDKHYRAHRLRNITDNISELSSNAQSYKEISSDDASSERGEGLNESPHPRASPTHCNHVDEDQPPRFSVSPVRSVKTIVTKSSSVIDVSEGTSNLSQVQRRETPDSSIRRALPRSTSTPGLASSILSPDMTRPVQRSSTSNNIREFSELPMSLRRAQSLDVLNGYNLCIVCRTCSNQAKEIRPGRHFVLSWKQIIALTFALSFYIAGGSLLFVQVEYAEEGKRRDNIVQFFEGFIANHSTVQPADLLQVADTLVKDPNLVILLLREIKKNHNALGKRFDSVAAQRERDKDMKVESDKDDENVLPTQFYGTTLPELEQDSTSCSPPTTREGRNGNSSGRDNTSIWITNSRVWNFPNSLGFVISALTTIGYGHVVPRTVTGRLTCVAYGIVGIPLMLLFLGGIGEKMRRMTSRFIMRKQILPCNKRLNQALNCTLLGMMGVMLLFVGPSLALTYMEGWSVSDAVYYCFISLSTIGFGDLMLGDPTSASMKNQSVGHNFYRVMSLVWMLFGLAYVGMCITSLAHLIIRGSCGANNVETMRLKAELKRLKHEIRAQRLYTRRSGLNMWASQTVGKDGGRWDFDLIAEDSNGQKF